MRNREFRVYQSVIGAAQFVDAKLKELPELSPLARRLSAQLKRLQPLVVDDRNTSLTRDAGIGRTVAMLKDDLRAVHLIPIARAARRLMRFAPGVARTVAVPPKRASTDTLVRSARALVKSVRPGKKLFIEVGFPRDFLERCTRKTDELAKQASQRGAGRAQRAAIVKSLVNELRAARQTVAIIDALLFDRLRSDGSLAVQWRSASRVGRRMGRPLKKAAKAQVNTGDHTTEAQ